MNELFFGDNLDVLREKIKDESVDLVYLDPPFNSNANYNVLYREGPGIPSEAQAEAFRDTWQWGETAAISYDEACRAGGKLTILLSALRAWLGDSAMMAYLAMMAVRLQELRRVVKPTGSLYLHCDPTASHYLKLILDAIFGHQGFLSEITWKRTSAHSSARRYGPVHDTIFFYAAGESFVWNPQHQPYDAAYLETFFDQKDADGRRWKRSDITGAGTRRGETGLVWRGIDVTAKGRHWAYPPSELDRLDRQKRIHWPKKLGGMPRLKQYPEDLKGVPLQDVWTDIRPLHNLAQERLGYPTQKPVSLLERIITASTNPGMTILDPFCGCGTTIEAAENLKRQWIGIDVTHYAITLIERRLAKSHAGARFKVNGRPTDMAGARDLARRDKYQFQWWAAWLLGAHTYETKKGADRGIDGNIYFANGPYGHGRIVISVKGGDHITPAMVRELSGVIQREKAEMGVLACLAQPTRAMIADAAGAGFVEKSAHGRLPKVQVVTIADLLEGRLPKLPPLPRPVVAAARRRAQQKDQLELLLPFKGDGPVTADGATIDPRYLRLG